MSNDNSNTAIESCKTIKSTKITSKEEAISPNTEMKTKMVHDAIPHYIRAGNCNNSTDTNKDEENTLTLQVNSRSRPLRSLSIGNLAKKTSFKSFESIQQSCKRSCTNSHESLNNEINDSNLGPAKDPNFTSNSSELMEKFNKKNQ